MTYRAELSGRALKQMHGPPGGAGLITYLINDGASVVLILDITWAG